MKRTFYSAVVVILTALFVAGNNDSLVAQDRHALKAPNGIAFSEIRGYETWQVVAPSYRTDNKELRVILGNPAMINAYKKGTPGNGKPFPNGSIVVKMAWSEKQSTVFPPAFEPDVLKRVEFIIKNSARFPNTNGWGYARFVYDAKTSKFTPYGKDASFEQECHQCHTLVKARDFIFTGYPQR